MIESDGALMGQALATLASWVLTWMLGRPQGDDRRHRLDLEARSMSGFYLFATIARDPKRPPGPPSAIARLGAVKPIVERTYKLEESAEALRHLIEDRRSAGCSGWVAAPESRRCPALVRSSYEIG